MITEDKKVTTLGVLIWILASLFFLYEFFLRTFIGTVANQVMNDLTLTVGTFAWVTSAYYFSYAAMQIPVGILLDKFGVRKILIFATSVCAFSSFCFAHSSNFPLAFLSRLIMGFGSAFGFICLLVVASNWFPRRYTGVVSGTSQFIGTLGPILAGGPMVTLLMATSLSWQRLMDMIGLMGFALAFIMLFVIKNKNRDGKSITIYLQRERPILHYLKTLSKNPQVWFIAAYSGMIYVPMTLLGGVWGIPYLESLGFTNAQAANVISVTWMGYAIGAISFGGISDRIERRRPVLVFSALMGIGLVLGMIMFTHQSIYFYTTLFLLLGFSSAGQTVAFSVIAEHVDLATKATAMGINNTSITLLSSFTPIAAGYLIHAMHTGDPATLLPRDFFSSFMIMPILSAIAGTIAIFFIKETYCKYQKDPIYLKVDYKTEAG
ncbi:MAG: MFS transporter [Gammaproteobacteria bacterium]|nr:MFS transporter [Gammaproteobacteria bacterium]